MEFHVLGPVEVAAGGRRTGVSSSRRRTALAVLLAAGGATVPTGRLIHALWGGAPPATARKSLQSHLSRLRRELVELDPGAVEPLVTEVDGYRVDLDAHGLDAARFEELVGRAREVVGAAPGEAVRLLDDGLSRWRGPAFGELAHHPDVRVEAVRLEELRAGAQATHVDARLALGRHEEVVGELDARVVAHPLDERAHRQLMLALFGNGRQADALGVYQHLQRRLREELGVDPSAELREAYQGILRQDPGLRPSPSPTHGGERRPGPSRPPGGDAPRHHPVRTAELIGRDEEVGTIAELITREPLLTLTGPGGVGKTRLAEQAGSRVADRFDDGIIACSLAGVRTPEGLGGAMITALGIQPTGEHTPEQTLVSALGERRLLLLLDNCEHLLTAVSPLVDAILRRCPNVAVLATSRERLHLTGERVWQVAPLPVPAPDAGGDEVEATPAGALFTARARAVAPGFAVTDDNAAAVAELCRRLDGMPLAIELAAARMPALAPGDLAARLDRRFSLLAGGPRHEAGRHRTLQAVVAWSYDLLEATEAVLFDRLSVFAGTFSLEAAEQVCAGGDLADLEVAGLLGELVDKSMVVVEHVGEQRRYRLLDTLREYGARRLAEGGHTQALSRAHADYHLGLAEHLGPQLRGPAERDAVRAVDAAFDDLRSAHAWMVETGDVRGALRLPAALGDFSFYRLRDEMTSWAWHGLELAGAPGHPDYAAALATAAHGETNRDECARAHRAARRALNHAEPTGPAAVRALGALATAALYEGRLDDTLRYARRQAEAAEQAGEAFHGAFARVCRVVALLYRGDRDAAVADVADLQKTADASGSPSMRAFARYCRGETQLDTRPVEAAASLEEAVELARHVDNALVEGVSLVSLASLRGRQGHADEALRLFRQVVLHWRRLGDHTHQLTTVRNLVELLTQIGADEPAAVLYGTVTEGLTPSFGAEAQRLAAAWRRLEERLGAEAAEAAARRGRGLTATQMGDVALSHLDALCGT